MVDDDSITVESWSTDTRLYGQFRFPDEIKVHIFSLELTGLLRTPVNTDNGHFSVFRARLSSIFNHAFTLVIRALSILIVCLL